MSEDRDLDVVRRAIDCFELGPGVEPFFALFDPGDVEIVPLRAALEDTVYRGPDAPRRFVEGAREAWESLRLGEREVRRVGERILAVLRAHARSRDAGLELDFDLGAVFRLRDGRITHIHAYMDPADAVAAAEAQATERGAS